LLDKLRLYAKYNLEKLIHQEETMNVSMAALIMVKLSFYSLPMLQTQRIMYCFLCAAHPNWKSFIFYKQEHG